MRTSTGKATRAQAPRAAPLVPAVAQRSALNVLPMLAPAVAPVSRAQQKLSVRKLANAIVAQATGTEGSLAQEKTTNPLPIVFISAEVRAAMGLPGVRGPGGGSSSALEPPAELGF